MSISLKLALSTRFSYVIILLESLEVKKSNNKVKKRLEWTISKKN